jgi:hypothetical protein
MVLIFAILLGISSGLLRAFLEGHSYRPARLSHTWLLVAAFLPQILAFYLPATRLAIPAWLASLCLVSSQIGILAFVWLNRKLPGLWVLALGLAANLLVIATNGGLMPITPAVVAVLYPGLMPGDSLAGSRLGWSKNIILSETSTNFSSLSDCITLPAWFPWQYAFSPGDILIAAGVFWLLWAGGGRPENTVVVKINGHAEFQRGVTK